jgi:hypothetical protein
LGGLSTILYQEFFKNIVEYERGYFVKSTSSGYYLPNPKNKKLKEFKIIGIVVILNERVYFIKMYI